MAVPLNPTKSNTYTEYGMGPVGIAFTGAFFYNHLSTPQGSTAVFNEKPSFDTCNGHSDRNCRYHYHMWPKCFNNGANCSHVGYMLDGFPVYTRCFNSNNSKFLKSCYFDNGNGDGSHKSHYSFSETNYQNGNCDLDKANGYTFTSPTPNGYVGYAYIFTDDYPFIMSGYYGSQTARLCYI